MPPNSSTLQLYGGRRARHGRAGVLVQYSDMVTLEYSDKIAPEYYYSGMLPSEQ